MRLFRRNPTIPNPGNAPPQSSGGTFGGPLPPSLVTNQKAFRATTAQIRKTAPPQSETSPRDSPITPPVPPRQPSLPPLPPRNSGVTRKTIRCDTPDSFSPALDFPSQSQSPTVSMPTPTLQPPQSPVPPPTTFGGGFIKPLPPQHGSGYGFPKPFAADVNPPHSDSGPPDYDPADISGGTHASVWPTYNEISEKYDEKKLAKWNTDLDVLLIFAALFSAIVTSFLITALSNLGPDYQQQSALLLHQLLNGRDPGLASVSDPTAPFEPSGFAIAVNCLWFASLSASLGASFGAMICKEWLTEYNGGANPVVDLFQVCQRQVRFMAFQRWNVETLIGLLPPLLHSSVILFFTGAVIYLWQIDVRVAIVYIVIGGVFSIIYFLSTFLPIILNAPFRPYSTLLILRLSVWIKNVIVLILDAIAHVCYVALRYVTAWILWPFARTIFSKGDLHTWYMKAWTILPAEYNHVRVRWAGASSDSLEKIDTSHRIQEEAILWLSQMPLDATQSKAVVSSLAQFSLSRPHRFPQSVVVFLNFTLESSFHKAPGQVQADVAIDCLLVLGRIKFQSVVDRNRDEDLNVGGIKVTTLVAWAAQQLIANASDDSFDTQPSEGTRARLLTAAAWLSPVEEVEEVTPYGEKLKIQDRWEFVEELRMTLAQHTCKEDSPIDNNIFIDLIHGMHACIPRGDYGSPSSIVSFLPLICNNYDSLWSEDESVLRALITYALDLLLPIKRRKPLVEREIEFNKLTSELIDVLKVDTTSPDVVAFGFWLIYRVPYAFKSRKSTLADIGYIWTSTNGVIPQDLRQRMNFHAVDALVAVVQHHASANRKLPNLAADDTLNLLTTALEDNCTQQMATYAVAMILYLGTSNQAASLATGLDAESFTKLLDTVPSDLEKGPTEEGVIEFYIHLTLVLLKLPQRQVDGEKVKALIKEMERTIGVPNPRDSKGSKAEINVEPDRVKWKAIYLCGLLFQWLPLGEREGPIERIRERVQTLLRSEELLLAGDYNRCIEPLNIGALDLGAAIKPGEPKLKAFEVWTKGFPFSTLVGSVYARR